MQMLAMCMYLRFHSIPLWNSQSSREAMGMVEDRMAVGGRKGVGQD